MIQAMHAAQLDWKDLVCKCYDQEQDVIGNGYILQMNGANDKIKVICPNCGETTVLKLEEVSP